MAGDGDGTCNAGRTNRRRRARGKFLRGPARPRAHGHGSLEPPGDSGNCQIGASRTSPIEWERKPLRMTASLNHRKQVPCRHFRQPRGESSQLFPAICLRGRSRLIPACVRTCPTTGQAGLRNPANNSGDRCNNSVRKQAKSDVEPACCGSTRHLGSRHHRLSPPPYRWAESEFDRQHFSKGDSPCCQPRQFDDASFPPANRNPLPVRCLQSLFRCCRHPAVRAIRPWAPPVTSPATARSAGSPVG